MVVVSSSWTSGDSVVAGGGKESGHAMGKGKTASLTQLTPSTHVDESVTELNSTNVTTGAPSSHGFDPSTDGGGLRHDGNYYCGIVSAHGRG